MRQSISISISPNRDIFPNNQYVDNQGNLQQNNRFFTCIFKDTIRIPANSKIRVSNFKAEYFAYTQDNPPQRILFGPLYIYCTEFNNILSIGGRNQNNGLIYVSDGKHQSRTITRFNTTPQARTTDSDKIIHFNTATPFIHLNNSQDIITNNLTFSIRRRNGALINRDRIKKIDFLITISE
jgi:hypothetical protein|tara:strand:+ start:93 stop:635 length:543 start_codon:yes stop_codon:yes gene_type:complete